MLRVEVEGLDGLTDTLQAVGTDVAQQVIEATEEAARDGVETAKGEAPVDTGRLRESIQMQRQGNAFSFFSDVPYAPHQEYGTSNGVPAQRFMQKGADRMRRSLTDKIRSIRTSQRSPSATSRAVSMARRLF